ncbi:helix-turn-helix domain-containing protein, partial [Salmonella enterica]|nr:helix-turn-helix domain-containing protein [Salmonella enterica]
NGNVLGSAGVRAGDVSRQQVAIIYDVGLSTLYRKFPASNMPLMPFMEK